MIDEPEVTQTSARPAAVIHLSIARAEMPKVMGPAIGEVLAAVRAQGIGPAGALFAHHLKMTPETFDFELGFPVTGPVVAVGRVFASELPAAKVARTVYQGPYEGLSTAWGEFMQWIEAHGHTPAADFWETYLVGPESGPDSSRWRTEFTRPLVG